MLAFREFEAEVFLNFAGINWLKQATLYLLGHHKSRSLYEFTKMSQYQFLACKEDEL